MLAAASVLCATGAGAMTTVDIAVYDELTFPTVQYSTYTGQDFEGIAGGTQITDADLFNVGTFNSIGGIGTGEAPMDLGCADDAASGGNAGEWSTLCVGSVAAAGGAVHGRENVIPVIDGDRWLDTNDTHGILWDVGLAGNETFNQLSFTMQDATDQGAYVAVVAADLIIDTNGDGSISEDEFDAAIDHGQIGAELLVPAMSNGNIQTVVVSFHQEVTEALVLIASFETNENEFYLVNDGIGIDGIMVGTAIPLPAGVWLLLSGIGLMGVASRRRNAA